MLLPNGWLSRLHLLFRSRGTRYRGDEIEYRQLFKMATCVHVCIQALVLANRKRQDPTARRLLALVSGSTAVLPLMHSVDLV